MTGDEGRIFVEYTALAVVHMIVWGHHTRIHGGIFNNENNLQLCFVPLRQFIGLK